MSQGANRLLLSDRRRRTAALTPNTRHQICTPLRSSTALLPQPSTCRRPAAFAAAGLPHHCTCTCTCTRTLSLSFQLAHGWASTQQVHSKTHTTTCVRVIHNTQPPIGRDLAHTALPIAPVCAAAVSAASNACVCRVTGHVGPLRRQCCCTERKATKKSTHTTASRTAPAEKARGLLQRHMHTAPTCKHTVHTTAARVAALYTTRQPVRRSANRQTVPHPHPHHPTLEPHLPQAGTAHSLAHSRVALQQQPTDSTAQRIARRESALVRV
jgi:hypothetical protein